MKITDFYNPPSGSAAGIKKEAYDSMDEEEQAYLQELAADIRFRLARNVSEAREFLDKHILEVDEYNALWWILDSKERALLKGKR